MHRRAAAVFAVLLLGTGVAACSNGDDDKPLANLTTTTEVPTTLVATPTTQASGPASTPQAAADGLLAAWKKNDQSQASDYAKPQAISKMFAHPYNDPSVAYNKQPCEPQGGQFICAWTYEGGAVSMTVEAWPGGGFVVDSVTYIAD